MSEGAERSVVEKIVDVIASRGYRCPDDAAISIYVRTKRLQEDAGLAFREAVIQATSEICKRPSPDGIRRDLLPWRFSA